MKVHLNGYDRYQLQDILDNYSELIDNYQFESLYNIINKEGYSPEFISKLYKIFLEDDIDILQYMKTIPENFLYQDYELIEITIPKNIEKIDSWAFYASECKIVNIKNPDIQIIMDAFKWCQNIYLINYDGPSKLFEQRDLAKHFTSQTASKELMVVCKDQTLTYKVNEK